MASSDDADDRGEPRLDNPLCLFEQLRVELLRFTIVCVFHTKRTYIAVESLVSAA